MPVLWPARGLKPYKGSEGIVLGWREGDVTCVLAIVNEQDASPLVEHHNLFFQRNQCSWPLEILGKATFTSTDILSGLKSPQRVFLLDSRMNLKACSPSVQVIMFEPPDQHRLQYLTSRREKSEIQSSFLEMQDAYGRGQEMRSPGDADLILRMVNCTHQAQAALNEDHPCPSPTCPRAIQDVYAFTPFAFVPIKVLLESIRFMLNLEVGLPGTGQKSLKQLSATCGQVDLRVCQMLSIRRNFLGILPHEGITLKERSRRYMRFWNTVWLILNDLIFGYCASQFLQQSTPFISSLLPSAFQGYMVDHEVAALNWLNDWPVGLKLNTPLSAFFASFLGGLIAIWRDLAGPLLFRHSATIFKFLALASYGGLTLLLSVIHDLVVLLTLHLKICYIVTSRIRDWQIQSLGGLWNLFRGKRWNVLRQRTDSYQYDIDQLFLGTLLFTVSAFLFPTVLTYSSLFTLTNTVLHMFCAILLRLSAALNAFPLFEVLLRVKEPSRLPAGIHFILKERKGMSPVLELKNAPKSIQSILASS